MKRSGGFTYLALMLGMALGATALASAGVVWHTEMRRAKEAHLLFIGEEFKRAIASYYHSTPGPVKQLPRNLEDLLRDTRYPVTKRHLRQVYVDPMTGRAEWGLIQRPEGIHGVHSLSDREPFRGREAPDLVPRRAGSVDRLPGGATADQRRQRYSNWAFVANLSQAASAEGGSASDARRPPGPAVRPPNAGRTAR